MNIIAIIKSEAFCGVLLCVIAGISLLLANSPLFSYHRLIFEDMHGLFIVNEVLMSLFFFQIGKEIRHEFTYGILSKLKHALLPLLAALGGVIVPAIIYIIFNHTAHLVHGWAIPTATDIAFAVGVFTILANNFSKALRIILLSIAIIDDVLAILIIAIFYSNDLNILFLLLCLLVIIFAWFFVKKSSAAFYCFFGLLWFCLLKAGLHPTLSGVIIGMLLPPSGCHDNGTLSHIVNYFILPVFIFANSAVQMQSIEFTNIENIKLILGILFALCIGKPLGIFCSCYFGVSLKICELPAKINFAGILFISLLAGIAFTMSIFTILLSFSDHKLIEVAKIAVTCGSLISAINGLSYGYFYSKKAKGNKDL